MYCNSLVDVTRSVSLTHLGKVDGKRVKEIVSQDLNTCEAMFVTNAFENSVNTLTSQLLGSNASIDMISRSCSRRQRTTCELAFAAAECSWFRFVDGDRPINQLRAILILFHQKAAKLSRPQSWCYYACSRRV